MSSLQFIQNRTIYSPVIKNKILNTRKLRESNVLCAAGELVIT